MNFNAHDRVHNESNILNILVHNQRRTNVNDVREVECETLQVMRMPTPPNLVSNSNQIQADQVEFEFSHIQLVNSRVSLITHIHLYIYIYINNKITYIFLIFYYLLKIIILFIF